MSKMVKFAIQQRVNYEVGPDNTGYMLELMRVTNNLLPKGFNLGLLRETHTGDYAGSFKEIWDAYGVRYDSTLDVTDITWTFSKDYFVEVMPEPLQEVQLDLTDSEPEVEVEAEPSNSEPTLEDIIKFGALGHPDNEVDLTEIKPTANSKAKPSEDDSKLNLALALKGLSPRYCISVEGKGAPRIWHKDYNRAKEEAKRLACKMAPRKVKIMLVIEEISAKVKFKTHYQNRDFEV